LMESLAKSAEPVRDVMSWADKCCERLMSAGSGPEDRGTMSSRSVLIRWGYVTSQVMRELTIRSDPTFGAYQILKLFLDDWIALNVLRNVALSTTSVAASVEPVMHQHFITLSPMIGQDSFGSNQPTHLMNHTPTTSSMLAALQQDSYPPGPLDPSSSGFGPDNYGLPPFMDTSGAQDDNLGGVHPEGLSFPDYVTNSGSTFDVTFTPQDLGIGASGEQGSEGEVVKTEG